MSKTIQNIESLLDYAHTDLMFMAIAVIALFFSNRINKRVPYLVDYLLVEGALRVGTFIVVLEGPQNNLLLYSFISFFRFIYGYLIFKDLFSAQNWRHALALFGLAFVLYTTFIADTQELNAICMALVQFWWIIIALVYLNDTYGNMQIENLWKEPRMWVATGFLFYGTTTFFVYLFSSRIHTISLKSEALNGLWLFEHIGSLIFSICIFKAILLARRVN